MTYFRYNVMLPIDSSKPESFVGVQGTPYCRLLQNSHVIHMAEYQNIVFGYRQKQLLPKIYF